MGQTLNRAARWTSAEGGPKGKLEFYPTNVMILNDVVTYVENLPSQKPDIAKHTFVTPISWQTTLSSDDFTSGPFTVSGDNVTSEDKNKEGQPMFSLRSSGTYGVQEITIYCLEYANEVLKTAGEKKVNEVRACLEANPDPVAKICGERFTTVDHEDQALTRYVQEVLNSGQEDNEADKVLCRVVLDIMNFDQVLMGKCIQQVADNVRLRPADVEEAYKVVKRYCGKNQETCVLESLVYQSEYRHKYANGCYAPPWRQIYGDIAYLVAVPHDADKVHIVATSSGYYAIEGPVVDGKFEKEGDVYRELIVLLRDKSPRFSELMDQQDIFKVKDEEREMGIIDTTADLDGDYGQERSPSQSRDMQRASQKDDKKIEKKRQQESKKKLEPSLKWKNLTVEETKEQYNQKNEKTKQKQVKKRKESGYKRQADSDAEDSFHESSSESEEEEESPDRRQDVNSDLPSEYWQIQKLVKYLKGGNQTATIIALCSMRDFNLAQETCQLAIRDVGGLEVLINLLDTDEVKCKIGALKILKEISKNTQIRRAIADLGGLQTMVKILRDPNKELKCLSAETIANVAKFRRARRTVRQHGGIKKLVGLLDCPSGPNISTREQEKFVEVACCGALALWSCSKSTENKKAMRKAGAIPLLAKLLKSEHENMLIPVVGTLQECASEPNYRLAIRTEGMVEDLVKNLKEDSPPELQMHCASAIFKCAEEKETRDLVRQYGGLDPLVTLLKQTENKELLAAATGAIWKCAISHENVIRFQQLKAIDMLVSLLNDQPEEVLVNVVGALAELAKDPPNRLTIRKSGGIQPLVNLLTGTNQALLINVTTAVGQCAEEPDNMAIIDKLDGVRLLWSLLKNQNREVKASAAWAICPCIENAKDAGEMVRSFVGGLELIVGLLHIPEDDEYEIDERDIEVLASVCAAIAKIAKDEENLAVITDHNVVSMLSRLTNTNNDKLRHHLAEAIARCCNWGHNRVEFGKEGAVAPLVNYLKAKDKEVHRSTSRALYQLSKDPDNCITMHEAGVVKPLMEMVGSDDEVLQEAAAGCIGNIRRLALANEKARNK